MRTVTLNEDLAALVEGEKPLDEATREALVMEREKATIDTWLES